MTAVQLAMFSPAEARQRTDEVKADAARLWLKLVDLYERGAHLALGYPSWGAYFATEFAQGRSRGYQLLEAGRVLDVLAQSTIVDSLPTNEGQARELAPLLAQPLTLGEVWRDAVARYNDKLTAADIRKAVGEHVARPSMPLIGVLSTEKTPGPGPTPDRLAPLMTSDTPEWYTPKHIVDRVVRVLGVIDLDPCADPGRQIPARYHFTAADDGLSQPWVGRVYMNPPYGNGIDAWIERLVDAFERATVPEAIALVPARTDTAWWARLADYPVCFVRGRLKFSEHENSAPFPSAVVFLGGAMGAFIDAFADIGAIYERVTL